MFFSNNDKLYVVKGHKKRPILFGRITLIYAFITHLNVWEILFLRKCNCAIQRCHKNFFRFLIYQL